MTASARIGSNGSVSPRARGTATVSPCWIAPLAISSSSTGRERTRPSGRTRSARIRQRDRGGGVGAEAAVLDGHRDDDRPRRVRARRRRTRTGRRAAGARPCRSCRRPGSGPGSSRRRPSAEVPSACVARCRPVEDRLAVARVDRRPCARRASGSAGSRCPAVVLDRHPEVRAHDAAAVGDRGVGDRHLQRRGLQVALADREVDVVADRPRALVGDAAGRDLAALLARDLRARAGRRATGGRGSCRRPRPGRSMPVGRPKPELARPRLDDLALEAVHVAAERVEEDVGGDLQRAAQADRRR